MNDRLPTSPSPAGAMGANHRITGYLPVPGWKNSYLCRLMQTGAGVGFAASLMLIVGEIQAENVKRAFFGSIATPIHAGPRPTACGGEPPVEESPVVEWSEAAWPDVFPADESCLFGDCFCQTAEPDASRCNFGTPLLLARTDDARIAPRRINLDLNPPEIDRLVIRAKPTITGMETVLPLKRKKAHKLPGLRGWGA